MSLELIVRGIQQVAPCSLLLVEPPEPARHVAAQLVDACGPGALITTVHELAGDSDTWNARLPGGRSLIAQADLVNWLKVRDQRQPISQGAIWLDRVRPGSETVVVAELLLHVEQLLLLVNVDGWERVAGELLPAVRGLHGGRLQERLPTHPVDGHMCARLSGVAL
jgi:hypothetical protein